MKRANEFEIAELRKEVKELQEKIQNEESLLKKNNPEAEPDSPRSTVDKIR